MAKRKAVTAPKAEAEAEGYFSTGVMGNDRGSAEILEANAERIVVAYTYAAKPGLSDSKKSYLLNTSDMRVNPMTLTWKGKLIRIHTNITVPSDEPREPKVKK